MEWLAAQRYARRRARSEGWQTERLRDEAGGWHMFLEHKGCLAVAGVVNCQLGTCSGNCQPWLRLAGRSPSDQPARSEWAAAGMAEVVWNRKAAMALGGI